MKNMQSVAVIGGGVIGINTAYQLQKRGFQVTIFEPNGLGQGASFGNAGHFATEQIFSLADPALLPQLPKMLLDPLGPFRIKTSYFPRVLPWLIRFMGQMGKETRLKNSYAIERLNKQSIPSWQTLVEQLSCQHLMTCNGSLLTFEEIDESLIKQTLEMYQSRGIGVEFLQQKALKVMAPQLSDTVKGAIFFTQVGHTINPLALCEAVGQGFVNLGGKLITESVNVITDDPRPIVSTEQQDTAFDNVVVCAGAFSKSLVKNLGYNVPLETERGYHLMLPFKVNFSCPVASNDRKFIMTPMEDGLRLAGTVEFGGINGKPNYQRSDMLLTHAKAMISEEQCPEIAQLTLEQLNKKARWMGRRPSMPDSLPVIDRSPHNKSVFFNFGHQHLGLTWGAISGELTAQLVAGEIPTIDVSPYRISRF